jgi:DNA helicase-2/ATP-dependent DNA helicase PcrA
MSHNKILTIMQYLASELDTPHSGDHLLFALLHYNNVPAEEVAKVSRRAYKSRTSLRQYLKEWHQSQGLTMFTPPAEQTMMELSPRLEYWIRQAASLSPDELQTMIAKEFPLEDAVSHPEGIPEIAPMDPVFTDSLLSGFVMNVSALNSYLDCPLGFFYKTLLRAPADRSESMEFGSAVHYAVEKLFQRMQDGKQDTFPLLPVFIEDFVEYMALNRQSFSSEGFERRLAHGRNILSNYYNTYIDSWSKVVSIERNIRAMVNEVPVKGKIDKLEFDGNKINLVDYKSGSYERALSKLAHPDEEHPNGGDYWRQAVFYKILLDNYKQKNWQVVSTEFDFIEPDQLGVYHKEKVVISPADVTTVTQQIESVWEKIQQKDFYTGCGKSDCKWCNFVKENHLRINVS